MSHDIGPTFPEFTVFMTVFLASVAVIGSVAGVVYIVADIVRRRR